ncbi:MAG TPA: bifunctional 5,10-methylenetetrahydrofolate dehydrogenase/5,10-methenyltetrahydrofolate cyclohydrolase [Streptosporangiaceae bacterium]|jgi:methylenetetrahydrofolate dehydrogenase (NADP+) / methenyltetrahydrofolate cyclohydrolase|nr:bifunctional 5,10-methylenetetrahydrofolate dehydrogenase/5,10-methenyltetrahydrofolate cyclohydrolase [Streptosporangiaceae bacterium]
MTRLIDGRAIAGEIADEVRAIAARAARPPRLAVVLPSDDEAAAWYVRSIQRTAGKVGIGCQVDELFSEGASAIARRLDVLSGDPDVDGIICQTPLPDGLRLAEVGSHIAPGKDVDGANPVSLGRLAAGLRAFAPATAAAVLEILQREQVRLTGARAVVVGRSIVVGKPAALLLLAQDATVTVCHSRTADLASVCAGADVLVAAVGRAGFIGASFIKPGAVVIDVGTNPVDDGGFVGDVVADEAGAASALTPVPGGVGPVTTMMLMLHTARAATG